MRLTVSTAHSRMVLTVFQLQSPFHSFFREKGLLLKAKFSALK